VAFLDVKMPGMTGLEMAKRVKELSPHTNIVFVTAYSEYSLDAMRLRASGYVLKPATGEAVETELENLRFPVKTAAASRLRVQCFGNFEVYADGQPLRFEFSRTKELFAYLVDRRGAAANTGGALLRTVGGRRILQKGTAAQASGGPEPHAGARWRSGRLPEVAQQLRCFQRRAGLRFLQLSARRCRCGELLLRRIHDPIQLGGDDSRLAGRKKQHIKRLHLIARSKDRAIFLHFAKKLSFSILFRYCRHIRMNA
jgi:hypothetical protein